MDTQQVQTEIARARLTIGQLLAVADDDVRGIDYSIEQGAIRLQCSDFVHAQRAVEVLYTETLKTARNSLMGRVLPRMIYHYQEGGIEETLRLPLNV